MDKNNSHYISELEAENEELRRLLNSKRYKVINKLVNTSYGVIRKNKQNNDTTVAKTTKRLPCERKIEKGRVDIINVNFYDWDGEIVYKGGAERYVYDLACLLKKMGYKPRLIQGANDSFEKKYHGIDVIGIKMPDKNMHAMSRIYNEFCINAELVIASPLELASGITNGVPIVAINHGINFDHIQNSWKETSTQPFVDHYDALKNISRCVCVDTNFINWVRTRDYRLSMKLDFIPNYYDTKTIDKVVHTKHNEIIFVYPRRIYSARGYDIVLEAFEKILQDYPDRVKLRFVGQYDTEEIKNEVESAMVKYPNNISHAEYEMGEMYQAYNDADVVLVPTRYSEGTSLSCIEGMAAGAAVITTTIGGLPNLIIDGYNGLMVKPTADDIEAAARKLISHPALIKKLSTNGKEVAISAFQKNTWNKKWEKLLNETLSE